MGTQTALAAQIYNASADYVLALKTPTHGSRLGLNKHKLSILGINFSYNERVEKGDHRPEKRQVWTVPVAQFSHQQANWLGLKTVVMVVRVSVCGTKIPADSILFK